MSTARHPQDLFEALLGGPPPLRVRLWDGTTLGPDTATSIAIRDPVALRYIMWAPGELGMARAYVAGAIDIDGDIFDVLTLRDQLAARTEDLRLHLHPRVLAKVARLAAKAGALGGPPPRPDVEVKLSGPLHSRVRDARAISHHYDVGNNFYRMVLGPTMTYSCAYFADDGMTLDGAQIAKYDLVARKLGLTDGMRLLDVGCGWGGMVIHAAKNYRVRAVGITLSRAQADLAEKRIAEAGAADLVEIRYQDYRDVTDGPFDAISSIGMFEHVGLARLGEYLERLKILLRPKGRLLNHAIARPKESGGFDKRSFVNRYVFPDGELHEVGRVVSTMAATGFEIRDVHSLREHYARTLRAWVANLEANWDAAVSAVGEARARVWRLYMAGSAIAFEASRITIHQTLAVVPGADGASGMPLKRAY